jgi:N12 class adenine-specific DNA methylase
LVVLLTSRFTLDSRNRRRAGSWLSWPTWSALRLPEGAFRQVAGTDVVIDLVVLRRRPDGQTRSDLRWDRSIDVATLDGPVTANEVFVSHPEWVLGELSCVNGQYNDHDLTVKGRSGALAPRLTAAVEALTAEAKRAGLTMTPPSPDGLRPGLGIWGRGDGGRAPQGGQPAGHPDRPVCPGRKRRRGRLPAGTEIRRRRAARRDRSAGRLPCSPRRPGRQLGGSCGSRLNERYDIYTARYYGPLNRFSLAGTGSRHPETHEDLCRRVTPRMGGFNRDPDLPAVLALKVFDPDTGYATKAAIFERRVLEPRQPPLGADTAEDALAMCLDDRGRPDLAHIADLLGVDVVQARAALGPMVYDDPATGTLATAATYLSGDVRAKLAAAREAAERDPRWQTNVDALAAVQPSDLGPDEIDARLGSPWIPAGDVAEFAREALGCRAAEADYDPAVGWTVTAPSYQRNTVATTSEWGTPRMDAVALPQGACNQQAATVYDYNDDGTRILNTRDTLAAREKQEALGERFSEWVWENEPRAERLAERYNTLFNSTVSPSYDGSHLSLPGMSQAFKPDPHQFNSTWRMMSEPIVLMAHAVGAGKTAFR